MSTLHRASLAGILFCILFVTLIDVAGRSIFNAPLFGADDLVRFGMALLVYGALPIVCRQRSHITVDLLSGRWPNAVRLQFARLFALLAVIVLVVLAWRLIEIGLLALEDDEHSPLMRLPMAPLAFIMAGCTALAAWFELQNLVSPKLEGLFDQARGTGSPDGKAM